MNKILSSLLVIIAILLPIKSQAKINIFACEPEWQSLAKEIGKDYVKSYSATNARQDPHYIRAKPSLIAKIRKADLLICSGSDLEVGWLPILLSKAKVNVQIGQEGNLMASNFVPQIEKPEVLDRSMGDVHPQGNPHIHLDPYNILLVAKELNNRLKNIDPDNSHNYQKNYNNFVQKWKNSIKKWEKQALRLKGIKVLPYHKSFSYLFNWLKINEIVTLESKPGIAPTTKHLEKLLVLLNNEQIKFITLTPYDSKDASNWLNKKTKIKELTLPYTVGGNENSKDLFSLFDNIIFLMINNI